MNKDLRGCECPCLESESAGCHGNRIKVEYPWRPGGALSRPPRLLKISQVAGKALTRGLRARPFGCHGGLELLGKLHREGEGAWQEETCEGREG